LLNKALNNAVESNTLREKFALNGSEPVGGTPEQFAEFVKRESTKWAEVIKGASIKPD
jgi:tripartite-type tricarboxylate transporter receptor subunit TctC